MTLSRTRRHSSSAFGGMLMMMGVMVLLLAACGSSGGDADASGTTSVPSPASTVSTSTTAAAQTTAPTTRPAPAALKILVVNDDGYDAPGIDAVVEALKVLPGVTVSVVAPLTQQSGTGGNKTDGKLTVTDVQTASGFPAKAVDGFPVDSVRAAFDDLGIQPDLVVSGINAGQNLGPLIDVSGTVGAAREAVGRGVPALAVSQGLGDSFDFPAAIPFVLDWVKEHRTALTDGSAPAEVSNMNVPSCSSGKVKGVLEIPAAPNGTPGGFAAQECGTAGAGATNDVEAFNKGYVTLTENLRPAA